MAPNACAPIDRGPVDAPGRPRTPAERIDVDPFERPRTGELARVAQVAAISGRRVLMTNVAGATPASDEVQSQARSSLRGLLAQTEVPKRIVVLGEEDESSDDVQQPRHPDGVRIEGEQHAAQQARRSEQPGGQQRRQSKQAGCYDRDDRTGGAHQAFGAGRLLQGGRKQRDLAAV